MSKKSKVTLREEIIRERRKKMTAARRTEMYFAANRINTLVESLRGALAIYLVGLYGESNEKKNDPLWAVWSAVEGNPKAEFEA